MDNLRKKSIENMSTNQRTRGFLHVTKVAWIQIFSGGGVNTSGVHEHIQLAKIWQKDIVQGLFVPFACIVSGDPVRVLRLFHNKYTG